MSSVTVCKDFVILYIYFYVLFHLDYSIIIGIHSICFIPLSDFDNE